MRLITPPWSKITLKERSDTYIFALGARRWALIHVFQHYIKITYTSTMAEKAKVESDAAPSIAAGMRGAIR